MWSFDGLFLTVIIIKIDKRQWHLLQWQQLRLNQITHCKSALATRPKQAVSPGIH
jgi:hypothetical protein